MCGIFGYSSHRKDLKSIFLKSLKHRGPDSNSTAIAGDWTLGHLRLAIIDTSAAGNQPMQVDGNWLVFNGEIYNYIELKNKYLKDEVLNGGSDTEILLRLLIKFGPKILNKLNGMFAFAYFNSKTNELLMCRDRFGVKPLYWAKIGGILYFASETKPLVKLLSQVKLNPNIVDSYMYETVSDHLEESYISDVYQILPGYYATAYSNNIVNKRWYYGDDYTFNKKVFLNKAKTLSYFEMLLTDAIKLRYRSDVPVCLTLSGGLDSSVIYVLTKENLKKIIHPVIFQNSGSSIDEVPIAKQLTEQYGDKVIIVKSKSSYSVSEILDTCKVLEFPIWNPSAVAYKHIYKEIRSKGFKVVIEGHGSDEQLGGYPYMVEELWKQRAQAGHLTAAYQAYRAEQSAINTNLDQSRVSGLFLLRVLKVIFEKLIRKYDAKKVIFKSFDRNILPMVLRAFDRLSMSEGLESRCPFMDYRIVEFIRAMPAEYLTDELGSKAPLRHILRKYNKEFVYLDKPKVGFAIDIKQLFSQPSTKLLLKYYIRKFSMQKFLKEKKEAIEMLQFKVLNWQNATKIWKVCALSITKTIYETK